MPDDAQVGASTITTPEMLATITVSSRIPEFWVDQPRLWFIQIEAILSPQKLSDEQRYNLVVAKLSKDAIAQITDFLAKPPEKTKYDLLKEKLLQVFEESEARKLHKLVGEMELGDQRPSQLLTKMTDLARGKVSEETLALLWKGHLPTAVRAVLTVSEGGDLAQLAKLADKVMENIQPSQNIAQVGAAGGKGGVWSLRNLSISVPRAVLSGEGESVVLRCSYDLEGAALYSIKWYRADTEFYRYVPREMPPSLVFPLPGTLVDLTQSDQQQVRVVNMHRQLSGEYQCEVSADAPLFHTGISSAPLTVVDPPFRAPQLSISRSSYARGDILRANCSVDESYPPPNITWILDDHKIAETITWRTPDLDFKERPAFSQLEISILEAEHYKMGLTYTSSNLNRAYQDHYVYTKEMEKEEEVLRYTLVPPPSGQFSVSCVATIFDIYARKSEPLLIKEDAPHPASVTGEDSSGTSAVSSLVLTLVCACAIYLL